MSIDDNDFLVITDEEVGERLDKILARRFEQKYSRTYFQYLIEQDLVLLNGQPVKKRIKPQLGDEIEIQFVATPEIQLEPEAIPLSILYEDDELLVINKPAGMVIHPAPGNWKGTLVNALLYYCKNLPQTEGSLRPGIVHRLDKETSGVIVAAKTLEMQQKLTQLFADRAIYKEYIAICVGKPKEGEVSAPIGRHPVLRKEMAIVPNGRQAISFFKTLAYNEKLSIVQAIIATGRTHQIRVHLKSLGTAVLGDSLYGNPTINNSYGAQRQLLHALVLRFKHPTTGKELTFHAPFPEDMKQFLQKIAPKSECVQSMLST